MGDDFESWLAGREKESPADDGGMLRPGQRIGAYRIVRQLGVGGMGQVYEAEHVALGVRRALKVFSTESEHSEFLRKRFVAEGRILADLQHPRIVRVYDLVVDEDSGMAYFEMDLVLSPDGQPRTLADELQDGADEEKIVGWFKDICEGLAYIHSQGVVHRDISLDNILIGRDGRAVITDFGIAKIIDDSYRKKIDVTVTMVYKDGSEVRIGKERYMAPELKKPNGKASSATDAWALGVLLFRMLSGSWYDVGTRLEDWHADLKYDWRHIIAQLCNVNPEKRLGDGGIAALPNMLQQQSVSDGTVKNISTFHEVFYDLFRYLYLIFSIVTFGILPACTVLSLWIQCHDFKNAIRKTIGLLFGWRGFVGVLWQIMGYRLPEEVGTIIWTLVSAVLFVGIDLALKHIKKAYADDGGAWRVFNIAQWLEIIILSAYPIALLMVCTLAGELPRKYSSILFCGFTLYYVVVLVWQSGLKSLVSKKIRWAYKVEMILSALPAFLFAICVLAASCTLLFSVTLSDTELGPLGMCIFYLLLFPLSPIYFFVGLTKGVRSRFVEGRGHLSARANSVLKLIYINLTFLYYVVFIVGCVRGAERI